ncbi:MAG TPA: YdeI/OmpD-associated family protein [Terriglobales bacterium]|nr:YdeI/OmpD-associated family protein [Terriglobales bacterium]
MKKLAFKIKLIGQEGSSVAALNAPFDVKEVFGTIARVPVRGTINGFPFRSSLMPMGGCHYMAVNRAMREGASCEAGDTVSVVMELDTAPRVVEVPPVLKKALAKSKTAQANWKKYSFSNQKEMALAISGAKQEETRKRRLARIVDIVKSGKKWTP